MLFLDLLEIQETPDHGDHRVILVNQERMVSLAHLESAVGWDPLAILVHLDQLDPQGLPGRVDLLAPREHVFVR